MQPQQHHAHAQSAPSPSTGVGGTGPPHHVASTYPSETDAAAVAPSATAATAAPTSMTTPLYDMFLDLPHPLCSTSCPGPFIIDSPMNNTSNNVNNTTTTNIKDVEIFQELHKNIIQIVRFAFPEYDEQAPILPSSNTGQQQPQLSQEDVIKFMKSSLINKYDVYAMQSKASFQSFTFSLQLGSGIRVYGHVRRYLPLSLLSRTRYDISRRGERALIMLTRNTGADSLYKSILKTVEAISSQQMALPSNRMPHKGEPQKWYLYQLTRYQQHLASMYGKHPGMERGKPSIAAIPCIELGDEYHSIYKEIDTTRYIVPISLLQSSLLNSSNFTYSSSIVPLLRCVGVVHAIRIMAALLSERRILFVSSSPTRLATCSSAALAMLSCGLFNWQHLYIPVLPPHLWQYLAAPYPYLIGVLSSAVAKLDYTDGLGEVLLIHLDTNQLETRGIEQNQVLNRLPDLFRAVTVNALNVVNPDNIQNQVQGNSNNNTATSASEQLAQDLFEILKVDKRILHGITTSTNYAVTVVGETAAKATMAVKNTFMKFRDKGKQFLSQRSNTNDSFGTGSNDGDDDGGGGATVASTTTSISEVTATPENSMASDYIYTEGCHNEVSEEEARIAFTSFFLCLIGDMRWYLSTPPTPPGQHPPLPVLDRNKFLQHKRNMGEGEGTTIYPLLTSFCQTQMLEEFAKARIEEIRTNHVIQSDSPLFLQCASYHRQHHIDFGILNVKRIVRQIVENNPSNGSRIAGMLQTNARRIAMTLTSTKGYDGQGDTNQVIADLVDSCHECTSILFDVMSVIWFRLRDCKGMNWKHGLQALQILRNLLYHGPLAAITEAVDGLDKIRALKYYENMRPVSVLQIRSLASVVYNLLVDRAKLFYVRRACIERRRQLKFPQTEPKLERHPSIRIGVPFITIHAGINPNALHGTVVSVPPKSGHGAQPVPSSQPVPSTSSAPVDFFTGSTNNTVSSSGVQPQQQPSANIPAVVGSGSKTVVDLFDTMSVSTAPTVATGAGAGGNPFDPFSTSAVSPVVPLTPTKPSGNNVGMFVTQPPQTFVQQQQQPGLQQSNMPSYSAGPPVPSQQPLPVQQYNQGPTYAVIPASTPNQLSPLPPSGTMMTPHQQQWQQAPPFPQGQSQPSPMAPPPHQQQQWQQQQVPFQQVPSPQQQFPAQGQQYPPGVGVPSGYMPQQGGYPPSHQLQQYSPAPPQQQQQQQYNPQMQQQQAQPQQPNRSVASQFDPFAKR